MRDLKRKHDYSVTEQEGMYPFERDFLVETILRENLQASNTPVEGWTKYAQDLGVK